MSSRDRTKHLLNPKTGQQCSAHSSRTGNPCRSFAIRGGSVCVTHGGRAPQVKESARKRMERLVSPALDRIEGILQLDGTFNLGIVLSAAKDILDRTGHKPGDKLEVTEGDNTNALLLAEVFTLEELEDFEQRIAAHKAEGKTVVPPVEGEQ